MTDNRLLELIGKKQAGEISPSELIELNKLLQEDPAKAEFNKMLGTIWDTPLQVEQELTEEYIKDRWNKARGRWADNDTAPAPGSARRAKLIKLVRWATVAACIIALAGGCIWWLAKNNISGNGAQGHNNTVATKNGSHSRVELPDGSQVWLNAGSKLTYNESFGKETRELQLVGEAFFEVAKDAEHPFIIHTKAMNIRVVGTVFNVRAYPDEKTTEAALLRGVIEITLQGRPSDKMFLKPGEKISVRDGEVQGNKPEDTIATADAGKGNAHGATGPALVFSKIMYEPGDSTVAEAAWVKNKLIFRNKPFNELVKDMERWYNVAFIVKNEELLQKHFTGTFYNESVQEALGKLKVSYPFNYSYDKKAGIITIE